MLLAAALVLAGSAGAAVAVDRGGAGAARAALVVGPAVVQPAQPAPASVAPAQPAADHAPVAPPRAVGTVGQIPGGPLPLPRGAVALTFDDGPDPVWTAQVLAVLARYAAHATFFDIGERVREYPDLARAEYLAGNGVGSHTFTHPDLTTLSPVALHDQLAETDAAVLAATGHRPVCLRPPYNAFDGPVALASAADHEALVSYDIDPRDWARPGTAAIVAAVLAGIRPGSVVDLHDSGGDRSETIAALPLILQGLRARGLVSVALCR